MSLPAVPINPIIEVRDESTAPTVSLTRDFTDRINKLRHRTPRRTSCPHPAVVRKFAGAAPAQKKSQSCASASPLLLRPMIKTASPRNCIVSVWFLRVTRWSRARSGEDIAVTRSSCRAALGLDPSAPLRAGSRGHPSLHERSKIPPSRISPDSSPHSSTYGCSLPAAI
jgi:hypothetical protein